MIILGNQCITGEKIKLDGSVLNDCHAEILARRCLIRLEIFLLKIFVTRFLFLQIPFHSPYEPNPAQFFVRRRSNV